MLILTLDALKKTTLPYASFRPKVSLTQMKRLILASLLVTILHFSPVLAETISGEVIKVPDGDTIIIVDSANLKHRVRFLGIDAPEKNQASGQAC